jgi:hypothetical protein
MASPSPQVQSRSFEFAVVFIVLILSVLVFVGCGGGNTMTGGGTPTPTPIPTPTPTPTPPSTPASLEVSVPNVIVPPNGIYQYQVLLTEPKPIGNSSSRPTLPSAPVGPVRGVAVNDATGQATGLALIDPAGNMSVSLISPNGSLGTNNTYPLFTMTMPVNSTATPGTFPASLDSATFLDGSGNTYTILANTAGSLTIGDPTTGAQSITDVIPGGGLLPDRTMLRILGVGFTANTKIAIEGTTIIFPGPDTAFVNSGEIDVTLCNGTVDPAATTCPGTGASFQLDGERVRATNRDTGVDVSYFSYPRTVDDTGTSANSLVQEVHAMFSQQTYVAATIPYVSDATHFTGMALQNTSGTDATFNVELLDANGAVLPNAATGQILHARTRMARDISDWIQTIQGTPAKVRVTVDVPLQMLGLLGDTAAGTVTPVVVTAQ